MRCALTIAGSDSIGGAGIQADIKAMAALGVHACTAVTAVTAQNTRSVNRIYPVPPDMVVDQIETVLKDSDIRAIKTGMLYDPEIVSAVADVLENKGIPLVIDPVMIATVGDHLFNEDMVDALKKELIPICDLITPNKYEAEVLSGIEIRNEKDARLACKLIGKEGSSVLLKGGHMGGSTVKDYLYLSSEINVLEYPRLDSAGHGSGCVLSAYITAHLAKSVDIGNAVIRSRKMIQESISTMYPVGTGVRVVNPIVRIQDDSHRFQILDSLDMAATRIMQSVPGTAVPESGMNIAFATEDPVGPEDIAGIEGKMRHRNGRTVKGPARFGAAGHLSFVILEAMRADPDKRSAMNISYSDDYADVMEEVGMIVGKMDLKKNKNMSLRDLVSNSISKCGCVPDAMIDKTSRDRMIWIIGRDPKDITDKLGQFV